eukprot:m.212776 g.212776  ORF g.212776 m.212776 type:complete len:61 (+) comp13787_c0_seq54:2379-2561(+)
MADFLQHRSTGKENNENDENAYATLCSTPQFEKLQLTGEPLASLCGHLDILVTHPMQPNE